MKKWDQPDPTEEVGPDAHRMRNEKRDRNKIRFLLPDHSSPLFSISHHSV
jgi:hypothetical protein